MKHVFVLCLLVCSVAEGQAVNQINKQNKTLAVSAQAIAEQEPEIAKLRIGFRATGPTRDEVIRSTAIGINRVVKALENVKVPRSDMETEALEIDETPRDEKLPVEKDRRYFGVQKLELRVSTAAAKDVLAIAVRAGANVLETPSWELRDRSTLQAKAGASALAKAKAIAAQMAEGLHARLGDLIYASNVQPYGQTYAYLNTESAMMVEVSAARREDSTPPMEVLPQKISETATVYAVFAIE